MKQYVVRANDSIEATIEPRVDEKQANIICDRLAREDYDRNPFDPYSGRRRTYEEFRKAQYWRVYEVEMVSS